MAVLLQRLVLHHRGQLVVVADEDDALQAVVAVLLALQQHGDERLDLQDLGALLHQQVVVLEAEVKELPAARGGDRMTHEQDGARGE